MPLPENTLRYGQKITIRRPQDASSISPPNPMGNMEYNRVLAENYHYLYGILIDYGVTRNPKTDQSLHILTYEDGKTVTRGYDQSGLWQFDRVTTTKDSSMQVYHAASNSEVAAKSRQFATEGITDEQVKGADFREIDPRVEDNLGYMKW